MKFKFVVYYLLITISSFATEQKSWEKPTVEGFGIHEGALDYTEGFGAYMDLPLQPGTKNFDNGGGSHDHNTTFLKNHYAVENQVYDPFQRSEEHNEKVLKEVTEHSFDSATSNSVLNVIDSLAHRFTHILLSCESLKDFRPAYFKIWEGDRSSEGKFFPYGYQANRLTGSYQGEVEQVFGRGNVVIDFSKNLIIAYKNTGCSKTAPASDQQS